MNLTKKPAKKKPTTKSPLSLNRRECNHLFIALTRGAGTEAVQRTVAEFLGRCRDHGIDTFREPAQKRST